jgi:hypothetical protein
MSEDFTFDNSLITTTTECPVKGIIEHKLKRQGKIESLYGSLGSACHLVLENFFTGHDIDYCIEIFDKAYDAVIPPGIMPEEPMFYKQNIYDILNHYMFLHHPIENLPFEVVQAEENLTLELEPGFIFSMKRDLLVVDKASGFYFPVDHKFRFGKISPWWYNKFKTNSQISGYLWGTKHSLDLSKYPVKNSLLINAISLAELPKSNRKCRIHGVNFSECRTLHADFQFKTIERTQEQIEAWRRDIIVLAKQTKKMFDFFGSVELLQYAPRTGAFSNSCTFCSLQSWCRTGFNPDLMDKLSKPYDWRPWDGIEN